MEEIILPHANNAIKINLHLNLDLTRKWLKSDNKLKKNQHVQINSK
jgi:hypothetical protein